MQAQYVVAARAEGGPCSTGDAALGAGDYNVTISNNLGMRASENSTGIQACAPAVHRRWQLLSLHLGQRRAGDSLQLAAHAGGVGNDEWVKKEMEYWSGGVVK